ncbi:MAG: cyclodeaminase/cyclohydrolase family protein [Bacillota bacterium]
MSNVYDWTFRQIVEKAASVEPTPGGGSVSAMTACLGTAMVAMISNLTNSNENYSDVHDEAAAIIKKAHELMTSLENLTVKDMAAFQRIIDLHEMSYKTDGGNTLFNEEMQRAYIFAAKVPLEVAKTCLAALKIAEEISAIGYKEAISEAGVAAYICDAALKGALLNVDINLLNIDDQELVARITKEKESLYLQTEASKEKIIRIVQGKLESKLAHNPPTTI